MLYPVIRMGSRISLNVTTVNVARQMMRYHVRPGSFPAERRHQGLEGGDGKPGSWSVIESFVLSVSIPI